MYARFRVKFACVPGNFSRAKSTFLLNQQWPEITRILITHEILHSNEAPSPTHLHSWNLGTQILLKVPLIVQLTNWITCALQVFCPGRLQPFQSNSSLFSSGTETRTPEISDSTDLIRSYLVSLSSQTRVPQCTFSFPLHTLPLIPRKEGWVVQLMTANWRRIIKSLRKSRLTHLQRHW